MENNPSCGPQARRFRQDVQKARANPPNIVTTADLDRAVTYLTEWITNAAKAVGTVKGSGRRRVAGWWTEDCKIARANFASNPESKEAKKTFHNTVRNAKREYWASKVDGAHRDAEAFALAGWSKPRPPECKGPLEYAQEIAITEEEKLDLLMRTHILREQETHDPIAEEPEKHGQISHPIRSQPIVTPPETVAFYTIQGLNKAPGADGITAKMLRQAWPNIGDWITAIYTKSIELRHYPAELKRARVVFLVNPEKETFGRSEPTDLSPCSRP